MNRVASVLLASVLVCSSCAYRHKPTVAEGYVLETSGCTIYPDSMVFDNGMSIRAVGDSLLQICLEGITLKQMQIPSPSSEALSIVSGMPLLDTFIRLEQAYEPEPSASDAMLWAYALNPVDSRRQHEIIESRVKDGFPVPQDFSIGTWPVVNANAAWILAATENVKFSGNALNIRTFKPVVEGVVNEDVRVCRNPATGLISGLPHYLGDSKGFFPDWMQPIDLFECQTFGVNMSYVLALRSIRDINASLTKRKSDPAFEIPALDPDTLFHDVMRELWLPQKGYFSTMCYGYGLWPVALDAPDSFMQWYGIAMDGISKSLADKIVEKQPFDFDISEDGVSSGSKNRLTTMDRLAAISACISYVKTGRMENFDDAIARLLKQIGLEILSGSRSWISLRPLSSVMIRGLLGMKFGLTHIELSPCMPAWLGGRMNVSFVWQNEQVSINLSGGGNNVTGFYLNEKAAECKIEHDESGFIEVEGTLEGSACGAPESGKSNSPKSESLPRPPYVVWHSASMASVAPGVDFSGKVPMLCLWENGVKIGESDFKMIEIPESDMFKCIQIASVDENGAVGFSAVPHLIIPSGSAVEVPMTSISNPIKKIVDEKANANKFVESSKSANRNLKFNVSVAKAGCYVVDVHYLSGLGIVNHKRGTALRMCVVNDERCGVFVFPQLTPSRWDKSLGVGWQSVNTFSNPVVVKLTEGENTLELRYFQTTPVYLDPTANALVTDYVRLIRISE